MNFRFLLLPACLLLASCMVGPNFQLPEFLSGNHWKESRSANPNRLPDDWWRLFNDRELTKLIDRALAANNDLAAAKARVETAQALIGVSRSALFPALGFNGSAGASRSSSEVLRGNLPAGADVKLESQNYRSTFDMAYDPDLWGMNKRVVEASKADAAAAEAMLDSQRLGVATEVARQFFLLRGLDSQQDILENTLKSRKVSLEIQQSKNAAGLADGLGTSRAITEVDLAENDLSIAIRQRGATEHALAVLCATVPSAFNISHQTLDGALPKIQPSLPVEVLNRRPDVRSAEQDLRAANARIGVAEAAFYPSFSLSTGGGFESINLSNLLNWENRVLSLAGSVAQPIIDGGLNKSNYRAALSRFQESLSAYRQVLLIALREVEDALLDVNGQAKSRVALERACASSQDTLNLTQERYDKGLTSYFEVVDAERQLLQIQLSLSQLIADQHVTIAVLVKALGGGWSGK
ncbi:MAG: efflux transporter outer membrane subunit [Akkermansiaceae bacterium]|nr:efflux transporter outer membrane subunit [Akkermansiaceae bacterium]